MKKLEKKFIRNGFKHEQVRRTDRVAIYKRWKYGVNDIHYEVIKISKHNGYKLGASFVKSAETYPGGSLWGIQGWTHQTLESAQSKFKEVCRRFNVKTKTVNAV